MKLTPLLGAATAQDQQGQPFTLNPFLTLWLCADDSSARAWRVWGEYTNATTGAITNNGPKAYLYYEL
ncbi:hypothetical protein CFD26_104106 [Aspergillus turcosus]|uniref:Uncharacterized protein n=1 Tax=Aspergillus turcosus TaxID=1245748 RepID=A0A3R7F2E6_9EURO|nr:hypothetical protein CFD26_104106 [Aspergillus turcosus]